MSEWARPDRPYCKSELFKALILDNASSSEASCRQTIAERIDKCNNGVCPRCTSPCNYPVARTIGNVLKCTEMKRHYAFLWFLQTSDAGQLARSMHGARRKDNFIAVPERLAAHAYRIGHSNPRGYVQRDSISCRRDHRTSPVAHFAPGFDDEGSPIARSGYIVPCSKHSDCLVCGRHPLTSQMYRCQKRYILYDTVITSNSMVSEVTFVNTTAGASSSFDPDQEIAAITGKHGICVDFDSSNNEGCSNQVVAGIKDGIIGCTDGPAAKLLCGLSVDVRTLYTRIHTSYQLLTPTLLTVSDQEWRSLDRRDQRQPLLAEGLAHRRDRPRRRRAGRPQHGVLRSNR